jgi:hypothetical protein
MEDVIISQERTLDKILIDGEHSFSAYITVGLIKNGHFRIFLDFENLDLETLESLRKLYMPIKAFQIKSELLTREQYNISHIIIEKFRAHPPCSISWECISDDINCSLL